MKIERITTHSPNYAKYLHFAEEKHVFFCSASWVKNYSDQHLNQCAILNKNNDIIGCFIYYTFNKFLFRFSITPPFAPNIDLFYINPAESVVGKNSFTKDILDLLADYFANLKVDYINLNLPEAIIDSQPFIWKGFTSKNRYTYLIDLSRSTEDLWNNLSTEKRKSINKAVKDELHIIESTDYPLIYELIYQSLDRNNKAKNLKTLQNILFNFSDTSNSFAFVAYQNEKAIGASFCVISASKAIYLFGGFDAEQKHHGAGVSCMWKSILKAKELNLSFFDFEGSMNETIERYFREFGGELRSYVCIEKIKPVLNMVLTLKNQKPV